MARPSAAPIEEGLLDPRRTVQIGIRGSIYSARRHGLCREAGIRVMYMEEFARIGVEKAIADGAARPSGDGPTYISFDVDGLDPVYAPGTGTPEIGGLTTWRPSI